MNKVDFIDLYKKTFINKSELKLTFNMSSGNLAENRVKKVIKRFKSISNYLLKGKEVWIVLIIWDAKGRNKIDFLNTGFDLSRCDVFYKGSIKDEVIISENFYNKALNSSEIFYLKYEKFKFENVNSLVYSKAGFELGLQNTSSIITYFICFQDTPILLNLYDDRGMELLISNQNLLNDVYFKFKNWIITPKNAKD